MTTDQELQEELVFKRFPADKQEQVRGLVSYAMLMGLDGKDLTSIGQKLTRMAQTQVRQSNSSRVADFERLPVQKNGRPMDLDDCFRLKTLNGHYKFTHYAGNRWEVASSKTNVVKRHFVKNQDAVFVGLPRYTWGRYNSQKSKQLLLDIADGHLVLDF